MVVFAEEGIRLHIAQRVIHPPHVPFEVEAEAVGIGGTGDTREGGGFLRDHERSGRYGKGSVVHCL